MRTRRKSGNPRRPSRGDDPGEMAHHSAITACASLAWAWGDFAARLPFGRPARSTRISPRHWARHALLASPLYGEQRRSTTPDRLRNDRATSAKPCTRLRRSARTSYHPGTPGSADGTPAATGGRLAQQRDRLRVRSRAGSLRATVGRCEHRRELRHVTCDNRPYRASSVNFGCPSGSVPSSNRKDFPKSSERTQPSADSVATKPSG
jgi:hypothetical protein